MDIKIIYNHIDEYIFIVIVFMIFLQHWYNYGGEDW